MTPTILLEFQIFDTLRLIALPGSTFSIKLIVSTDECVKEPENFSLKSDLFGGHHLKILNFREKISHTEGIVREDELSMRRFLRAILRIVFTHFLAVAKPFSVTCCRGGILTGEKD